MSSITVSTAESNYDLRVSVEPEVMRLSASEWGAHLAEFDLTGYGNTEAIAIMEVEKQLRHFANDFEKRGKFTALLARLGIGYVHLYKGLTNNKTTSKL